MVESLTILSILMIMHLQLLEVKKKVAPLLKYKLARKIKKKLRIGIRWPQMKRLNLRMFSKGLPFTIPFR